MSSLGQGQVIAGIITAVFNIISIATVDGEARESPSNTAFYCFLVGALFIIVDAIALLVMTYTHFYKVHDRMQQFIIMIMIKSKRCSLLNSN